MMLMLLAVLTMPRLLVLTMMLRLLAVTMMMAVGVSGPPRGNSGKRETGKSDNGPGEARGDGETEVAKSNRLFYG